MKKILLVSAIIIATVTNVYVDASQNNFSQLNKQWSRIGDGTQSKASKNNKQSGNAPSKNKFDFENSLDEIDPDYNKENISNNSYENQENDENELYDIELEDESYNKNQQNINPINLNKKKNAEGAMNYPEDNEFDDLEKIDDDNNLNYMNDSSLDFINSMENEINNEKQMDNNENKMNQYNMANRSLLENGDNLDEYENQYEKSQNKNRQNENITSRNRNNWDAMLEDLRENEEKYNQRKSEILQSYNQKKSINDTDNKFGSTTDNNIKNNTINFSQNRRTEQPSNSNPINEDEVNNFSINSMNYQNDSNKITSMKINEKQNNIKKFSNRNKWPMSNNKNKNPDMQYHGSENQEAINSEDGQFNINDEIYNNENKFTNPFESITSNDTFYFDQEKKA